MFDLLFYHSVQKTFIEFKLLINWKRLDWDKIDVKSNVAIGVFSSPTKSNLVQTVELF